MAPILGAIWDNPNIVSIFQKRKNPSSIGSGRRNQRAGIEPAKKRGFLNSHEFNATDEQIKMVRLT